MEKSLSLLEMIKKEFDCTEVDIRTYSPLSLAFLGDSVFDFVIRTIVVERGNRAPQGLHKTKSLVVKAQTQAAMAESLLSVFTEEEEGIYRRGRNAKSYTSAKNASVGEYRKATGLEALMGYLYLTDRMDRVLELIKIGLENTGIEI